MICVASAQQVFVVKIRLTRGLSTCSTENISYKIGCIVPVWGAIFLLVPKCGKSRVDSL